MPLDALLVPVSLEECFAFVEMCASFVVCLETWRKAALMVVDARRNLEPIPLLASLIPEKLLLAR